jgi:NAD(P)-dependent dehydrogenase (short-subunit alcohol dehydrogenase family)
LLILNAGAYGPPRDLATSNWHKSQTLDNIDREAMMYVFQLNTVVPLDCTKALLPNLQRSSNSKVIIISSLMGSIHDNTGGGHYAYRAAKAAVNMVGTSLSVDLKEDKIAVGLIHPGYVYTDFGGTGQERQTGQRNVDESVKGVLEAIDQVSMETTGCFLHGNYGEGVKPIAW